MVSLVIVGLITSPPKPPSSWHRALVCPTTSVQPAGPRNTTRSGCEKGIGPANDHWINNLGPARLQREVRPVTRVRPVR